VYPDKKNNWLFFKRLCSFDEKRAQDRLTGRLLRANIRRKYIAMPSATALRLQVETVLAQRIPSALTPRPKVIRPIASTGVASVDAVLEGGLPVGAITELLGPESSGRSGLALSFVSRVTDTGRVCAWGDVSDALCPESTAEAGVDLARLLWVRCGAIAAKTQNPAEYKFALPDKYMIAPTAKKGLHGGGCGGYPRNEAKGLPQAINGLLRPEAIAPRCAEPQARVRRERETFAAQVSTYLPQANSHSRPGKPWSRIEQALRVTDLLLQAGGFSAIVLDMASFAPEYVSRVPLATWFRYRAAAERTQASLLLLAQHPCAKSSSELSLRFQPVKLRHDEKTVFTGLEHSLEVKRRFAQTSTNIRKPPQGVNTASWHSQPVWAGVR
jgi:hypothetical protein